MIDYPADRAMQACDCEPDGVMQTLTLLPPMPSERETSSVAPVMTSPVSEVIV